MKLISFYYRLKLFFLYPKPIKNLSGGKKVFISYLTRPLLDKRESYQNCHQNIKETIVLSRILKDMEFGYDLYNYDCKMDYVHNYDVIFGIEPNFLIGCKQNQNAIKIYYATGAYYEHQNKQIKTRTDQFNKKYNVNIPYRRMVEPHNSAQIADIILQIGTKETIYTYPEELRHKIQIVNQSTFSFKNVDLTEKMKVVRRNTFVWFGSSGLILKGLDLVLDYFQFHKEFDLHIMGNIEPDFMDVYFDRIKICENIFIHGFVDINSDIFRKIMNISCFVIYPSGSEGGCPGSVLNAMKLGVIPIVSNWAAPDDILNLGFMLEDLSLDSIKDAIEWSLGLSDENIRKLISNNHKYIMSNYTIELYGNQMVNFFKSIKESLQSM